MSFNFAKVWQIAQILLKLFQAGHDAGLYNQGGAPINSLADLHNHLKERKK